MFKGVGMADTSTKVGLIVVIILLVVFLVASSDYMVKIEPKTTTMPMVTTQPTTTSVKPPTPVVTTTTTTTVTFDCSNAGFKLISGSYAKSKAQLTLTLENTKSVDLTMEHILFAYPNNAVIKKTISGLLEGRVLEGRETKSFLISQVEDDFFSGQIITNCPDVTVGFTYSDVT